MKTLSLGYDAPDYGMPTPSEPGSKDQQKMKEVFPSITLQGDAAKKLMKEHEIGDEITATVTFKVVGKKDKESSRDSWDNGCTLDLDATSIQVGDSAPAAEDRTGEEMSDTDEALEAFEKEQTGGEVEEEEEEEEEY